MIRKLTINIPYVLEQLDQRDSMTHRGMLLMILAIGVSLRLLGASLGEGYHYFAINDELAAYQYALGFMAGEEKLLYLGQPSFSGGQAPGPYWTLYWLLLLKLGNGSVVNAIYWMTLLNSFSVYLVYKAGLYFLQPKTALLTSFLFASAPWTVYYATGMWNPLPMVLIGGLLLLALIKVINNDNSRYIVSVCLLAAIMPQFHMIGIFFIPALLLLLYFMPARLNRKWFALGIASGFLVYLPYLIGDGLQHWENTRAILAGERGGGGFSASVLKVISAPITVLSSAPGRWPGETLAELRHFGNSLFGKYQLLYLFSAFTLLVGLLIMVGFLKKLFSCLQANSFSIRAAFQVNPRLMLLFFMIIVPLLLFVFTGHNYATRYTIVVFPALFLVVGILLESIRNRGYFKTVLSYIVIISIFNIYLLSGFFTYQQSMIRNSDKFMASFAKLEEITDLLQKDAGDDALVKLTFDKKINALEEINRKTIVALAEYIDIRQKYTEAAKIKTRTVQYSVRLSSTGHTGMHAVYANNGVIINRENPGK